MWVSELDLRAIDPAPWLRVTAPLVWDDPIYGRVEFPAGTLTDLGSTPQPLHRFESFDPLHTARKSAVGHDFLYRRGKWPDGRAVTRQEADEFLRRAMIAEGHSAALARSWWLGVRLGGWRPWGQYREADRDNAAH